MEHMAEEVFTALMLEDMECIPVAGVVVMEDITFKNGHFIPQQEAT
jgi:hypothetical protein